MKYKISNDDILKPENYFHKFDLRNNQVSFLKMDRDSFKKSPFLDHRIQCASITSTSIDLTDSCIESLFSTNHHYTCNFIFHTAYCCSTLLSRAVDISNKTMVYREPVTLHQLAVMQRRKEEFPEQHINSWDKYFHFTLKMLSKTWSKNEISIIKPTDSCNNIIPQIMTVSENSKAILLYSKLKDFIASNLKSEGRRKFLKNFVMRSTRDAKKYSIFNSINPETLDDAKSATFVWMVSIMLYLDAIDKSAHCKTLDAEKLLDDPFNKLKLVSKHLRINLTDNEIEDILSSPSWNKHAKNTNDVTYSNADRQKEKINVLKQNANQVEEAIKWSQSIFNWEDALLKLEKVAL
ncbi:MAG: hypothetical protein DIZ80_12890 [endosymbiont of Galathealinum brachiosum]|uniref:Uncharacterized protein n=1 Tax=endosymbiont of Galathealinum brachiosum TaxID=2200906 RepID=A0A370D9H2_9GAMM|nr:MAG: hypothetical protein DIZ80_12890 [endosymbiont of Galathealinum brachiosum]